MKFAIKPFLILAVFLCCVELGYSRHSPLPQRPREAPPRVQRRVNRQPQTERPRRYPSPPRGRFANIPLDQRATLGNGLLAKVQGGGFRRIDNTYRVMATSQGFLIMVQDTSRWVSAIYYPETHEMVQVNRNDLADVRPINPGLIPPDDQIQLLRNANFEDFPRL